MERKSFAIKFAILAILLFTFMFFVIFGCNTTKNTSVHEPHQVVQGYKWYGTDIELQAIDYHYKSLDNDPDAYGQILIGDKEGSKFGVDVYKDKKGLYMYEWDPYTGHESKRYLTPEQCNWVIKL